ncbi:MAG: peptidoglycan DD-metalloendopeptidase family protein [Sideroxydans sp.]
MTAVSNIAQRTLWSVTSVAVLLVACGTPAPSGRKAPIVEHGVTDPQSTISVSPQKPAARTPTTTTKIHIVQKGDTLYSIAFVNGVDYRDVAEWNDIKDPSALQIGQQLKLNIQVDEPVGQKAEGKPAVPFAPPKLGGIRNQPKVGRLAYSEDALAKADRMQEDIAQPAPVVATAKPSVVNTARGDTPEEAMEWGMPTSGKVIADFSESANRKGVDITGKRSQAIVASASGKVVYSGSGLRGYGKLIIIKHNKTYLSAYAHNDQILVKEGQSVNRGQKIAEMGNTDADQVKLHFEIRKLGKPVDPAKYLPLVKS